MTIKILLVDDRYLIQEGVKAILRNEAEIEIVSTAKNGLEAIALSKQLQPDIVLLDIEMPQMNGIKAAKHIKQVSPATKIIMLSSYDNPEYITLALKAGASGYLLKDSFTEDLKQAIYSLSRGYSYIEAKLLDKVVRQTKANNIVNSQKTKVYVHKYRKNVYTPNKDTPDSEKSPHKTTNDRKPITGINRANLAPIFELPESDEIETIERLTASLKSNPTSLKKKNDRPRNNKKLILLAIAIASLILLLIIF